MESRRGVILASFLVVAFCVVLIAYRSLDGIERAESVVEEATTIVKRTTMYESTWVSGGIERKVTTKWREFDPNETRDQWAARHKLDCDSLLAVCPKD